MPGSTLTPKQAECLFLLAKGLTIKEVANKMAVSMRTTEHQLEAIKAKLGCTSKTALIKKAWELEFIRIRFNAFLNTLNI